MLLVVELVGDSSWAHNMTCLEAGPEEAKKEIMVTRVGHGPVPVAAVVSVVALSGVRRFRR